MRAFLASLLLLTLASCGPVELYYQPGVTLAALADDELTCEVEALKDAPIVKVHKQGAPTFIPPRRYCDGAGQCWTEGGYWEPGMVYTVDENRDLRGRLEERCMARRGYTPVVIPRCAPGVSAAGRTTVLPTLTSTSCAIPGRDGSVNIVQTP